MRRLSDGWQHCGLALAVLCGAAISSLHAASVAQPQVTELLAAGEFGAAAAVAAAVTDPAEQTQLLQLVARAQEQSAAASGVRGTLQRISETSSRAQAKGAAAQRSAFNGGGVMVDFDSLIQIIQSNTDADWEDVDGVGGTATPYFNGVRVAPGKLLTRITTQDDTNRLANLGAAVRKADLNADMAQLSGLRLVSLKRLEEAVSNRLQQGLPVPESMTRVAGLTKIEYIFLDAEHRDVILGGPAEAWEYGTNGEPVGVSSRRPTVQLDDLVIAFRSFAAGAPDFGCSINTRDEGVRALQQYAAQSLARGPLAPRAVRPWVNQLQQKLGQQDIEIWGVPADSRVARVIVEADYRMKLIGIGKLDAGKAIPSYFDLLPASVQKDPPAMEALRWWLTMKYDALVHSPDRQVFEIQGSAVLCQSENQHLTAEGKHVPTGKSEATNRQFAENFTSNYEQLAAKDTVFADLQNVFDLALVAALVREESLAGRSTWSLGAFGPQGAYRPASHVVPQQIESVVNHRVYNGRDIVVQVAGGVRGDLLAVVQDPQLNRESQTLSTLTEKSQAPQLPAGRWWWDSVK